MKFSIIGGGSWGTTMGQVLTDNNHEVMIYDINQEAVELTNKGIHPFFNIEMTKMKATTNLKEVIDFASIIVLSVPTVAMRDVLKQINALATKKLSFINISKGIEPKTLKRVSEIVEEEIDDDKFLAFAVLTGPSHAEELILRKVTLLTAASKDIGFAKEVQRYFSNESYLRVYTSEDLIGCEVGGSVKNAIAVVSGVLTGYGLGENARAALITRGIIEIIRVVEFMGGKRETAFGLTGIGDLIVTASSENSRNFKIGKKIGQGVPVQQALSESKMAVEGIRSIIAMHDLAVKSNIELPIIQTAYEVVVGNISVKDALNILLSRELKEEKL